VLYILIIMLWKILLLMNINIFIKYYWSF